MIKMNLEKDKDIREVFEEFIEEKKLDGLSEETIVYYENYIDIFIDYLVNQADITLTSAITRRVFKNYLEWISYTRNYSHTGKNTMLRAIRVFVYYLQDRPDIEIQDFKIKIRKAKKSKKNKIYSEEELDILLEKPDLKKTRFGEYRSWVVINFLLATGVRSKTLVNIKIKDLDMENKIVNLMNYKAHHEFSLKIFNRLYSILKEYLQFRDGEPDDYLFCSSYGDKFTTSGLRTSIQRYNEKRGVEKTGIHAFRHTFASLWIKNGGDPYRLMDLLDHQSMETTKKYVHHFKDDESIKNKNPLEKLAKDEKEYINLNK